jgi:hypothetical protein
LIVNFFKQPLLHYQVSLLGTDKSVIVYSVKPVDTIQNKNSMRTSLCHKADI